MIDDGGKCHIASMMPCNDLCTVDGEGSADANVQKSRGREIDDIETIM